MGKATSKVKCWNGTRAELYVGTDTPLLVGSKAWFEWLELPESNSFSFDTGSYLVSDFTARRENRKKGNYWYAYNRINGKLRSIYIGVSLDLTFSHLLEVGKQLLNGRPSEGSEKSGSRYVVEHCQDDLQH